MIIEVTAVDCPSCKARRGQPCLSKAGAVKENPCKPRWNRAEKIDAALADNPPPVRRRR